MYMSLVSLSYCTMHAIWMTLGWTLATMQTMLRTCMRMQHVCKLSQRRVLRFTDLLSRTTAVRKKKTMYLHVLFAKQYFPSGELHTCKTFLDEPRCRSSQSSLATLAMTVLSLSSPWLLLSCPPLTDDRGI